MWVWQLLHTFSMEWLTLIDKISPNSHSVQIASKILSVYLVLTRTAPLPPNDQLRLRFRPLWLTSARCKCMYRRTYVLSKCGSYISNYSQICLFPNRWPLPSWISNNGHVAGSHYFDYMYWPSYPVFGLSFDCFIWFFTLILLTICSLFLNCRWFTFHSSSAQLITLKVTNYRLLVTVLGYFLTKSNQLIIICEMFIHQCLSVKLIGC